MSASQRNKGAAGERELFRLLSNDLGHAVQRNLTQARGGGADTISIPGFSIEVKRQERLSLAAWWRQAVEQAGSDIPILFYRASRQPWRAVLGLHAMDELFHHDDVAVVEYDVAVRYIKAQLPERFKGLLE